MAILAVAGCVLVLSLLSQADGFALGAPPSTCFTQYPKHGTATQTTAVPFQITFRPTSYTPGQAVTVEVTDTTGHSMRGIQMAARRATGNTEEMVGSFGQHDVTKLKVFNCYGGAYNMITHKNNDEVSNFTFQWIAPATNEGTVTFRSTLLREFTVFWYDVEVQLPVASSVTLPVRTPSYPVLGLSTASSSVSFDSCGDTKGCFYYPRQCSGSDCLVAATFKYIPASSNISFELYANIDVDYISLGFSDDVWMGNDWTVSCTGRNGKLSVQEGWNPGYYNERHIDLFTSSRQVAYTDGKLSCRFDLPETFGIYTVIQGPVANSSSLDFDLTVTRHLMLAWGDAMAESSVLSHHHDLPTVTFSKVDLKSTDIYYSSSFHTMVRAHAAVMMVAWILVTGMVTVVSRHYRDWLPRTRLCATKVWFQIHRGLAVLVVTLTAIGLLLIFVHYGKDIREFAVPHAYVGLAVTGCVGLQMIGGIMRPDGDHKMRPIFNWVHRFLGHASHILAAATMFLAFDIEYVTPAMKKFGFITLAVWVAIQVIWHIVFEILSHRDRAADSTDAYDMDANGAKTEEGKGDSSRTYSLVFGIYAICLVGVCVAVLLAFLFF